MSSHRNETTQPPKGNGDDSGSIIATAVVLLVAMVIVALVLVYRMYRKRSGPLWITKFYEQDSYSSMRNDDVSTKDEQFIIGFSNPIMESATSDLDSQDGGVKFLGYKPLNTDKQPGEKDLFPREKLIFGPELGTGWFGKVYKGDALRIVAGLRKTKVIIKKLKDDATSQLRTRFVQEAEILKSLDHKNVLGILGKATEKEPYIVVFEYSPMGNLKEFLISHKYDAVSITKKGIPLNMAIDVATGLQYLHSNCIYYSDLAARNCVVHADLSVKIGDYGISRSLYENDYYKELNSSEESVPIRWLEPESVFYLKESGLTIKPHTSSSNVWSYGVTVWEVIEFGRQPYEELTDDEVIQSVIVDRLYQLPAPKQDGILASQLYETMRWCWAETSIRSSITDMLTYLIDLKENFPWTDNIIEPNEHLNDSSFHQQHSHKCATPPATAVNTLQHDSTEDITAIPKIIDSDTQDIVCSSEPCELNTTCSGDEKKDDIEITEICDDDTVPVTVISSTDQEGQIVENISHDNHSGSEFCEKQHIISSNSDDGFGISGPRPPVTYIGEPSDRLAEYNRRIAEGTQEVINPVTEGNEIVEVKYSGTEPRVIVENCASEYVVLPGDLVRRKSSLRREISKSRGLSVHFPANILDLRVINRYYKEDEEEEDGHVLSHDIPNDDKIDEEMDSSLAEYQNNRSDDILITGQTSEDDITTAINSSVVIERPTSPVEKKIKKALRRQKLNQHSDEWLFTIDHDR